MTKPRKKVYDFLAQKQGCVSAQKIHQELNDVDLVSIYRTLNLFEELKMVNVELIDKEKLYCLAGSPHHHIVCSQCGYMEKVPCDHKLGKFRNFTNINHQMTLIGLCNKCVSKKNEE